MLRQREFQQILLSSENSAIDPRHASVLRELSKRVPPTLRTTRPCGRAAGAVAGDGPSTRGCFGAGVPDDEAAARLGMARFARDQRDAT